MIWKRKAEKTGYTGSTTNSKARRRSATGLKQLAAGVRWAVNSWLAPAGSDASWEQSQDCRGAAEAKR